MTEGSVVRIALFLHEVIGIPQHAPTSLSPNVHTSSSERKSPPLSSLPAPSSLVIHAEIPDCASQSSPRVSVPALRAGRVTLRHTFLWTFERDEFLRLKRQRSSIRLSVLLGSERGKKVEGGAREVAPGEHGPELPAGDESNEDTLGFISIPLRSVIVEKEASMFEEIARSGGGDIQEMIVQGTGLLKYKLVSAPVIRFAFSCIEGQEARIVRARSLGHASQEFPSREEEKSERVLPGAEEVESPTSKLYLDEVLTQTAVIGFSMDLQTIQFGPLPHTCRLVAEYSIPALGVRQTIRSFPISTVSTLSLWRIPNGYCSFDFECGIGSFVDALCRDPLRIFIVHRDNNESDELIGVGMISISDSLLRSLRTSPIHPTKNEHEFTYTVPILSPTRQEIGHLRSVIRLSFSLESDSKKRLEENSDTEHDISTPNEVEQGDDKVELLMDTSSQRVCSPKPKETVISNPAISSFPDSLDFHIHNATEDNTPPSSLHQPQRISDAKLPLQSGKNPFSFDIPSFSEQDLFDQIRLTPEYLTAFDLERWKQSEIETFKKKMETEEVRRIRDVDALLTQKANEMENQLRIREERTKTAEEKLFSLLQDLEERERVFAIEESRMAKRREELESAHKTKAEEMKTILRREREEWQHKIVLETMRATELERRLSESHRDMRRSEEKVSSLEEEVRRLKRQIEDSDYRILQRQLEDSLRENERVSNERDDALRSKTNYKNQLRAAKQEIDRLTYLHRQVLVMEASRPHSNGEGWVSSREARASSPTLPTNSDRVDRSSSISHTVAPDGGSAFRDVAHELTDRLARIQSALSASNGSPSVPEPRSNANQAIPSSVPVPSSSTCAAHSPSSSATMRVDELPDDIRWMIESGMYTLEDGTIQAILSSRRRQATPSPK